MLQFYFFVKNICHYVWFILHLFWLINTKRKIIMKKIPLLSSYFNWIGFVLVFISFVIYLNGIYSFLPFSSTGMYIKTFNVINYAQEKGQEDFRFGWHNTDLGFLLIVLPSLVGLGMISFSKLRIIEDELISSLRLFAWSWSVVFFLLYSLLVLTLTSRTVYLSFVIVSPHLLFIVFILIFRCQLFLMNRRLVHEE